MDFGLDAFESLVKSRRATRHFKPDALPDGLIERLIDIAHWSPSGYNLQPTHFVVVTDPAIKSKLRRACMEQPQVVEAPAVIVLTGDQRVVEHQFEDILRLEREAGATDERYENLLRKVVPLGFGHSPLGTGWLWKALLPAMSYVTPIPSLPAVHKRFWLTKQVMLSAMTLMLAARAGGLSSLPMEGFDERRVKRVLGIPRHHVVPIVIPIGYAEDRVLKKTRLPIERIIHRDGW